MALTPSLYKTQFELLFNSTIVPEHFLKGKKTEIYHCPNYLNYCLMINRLAHGYVHKGTAFLQKKQFSVVRSTNYKGVM